jgi:hypothetical protein
MSSAPWKPEQSSVLAGRAAFENLAALSHLRRNTFEGVGPAHGIGILYGLGFAEGMFDGLRLLERLDQGSALIGPAGGTTIPMVFCFEAGDLDYRFEGTLSSSKEAAVHLRDYPEPEDPICFTSAGYAAGWYSATLGETILVQEISCVACGGPSCRFEAQRLEDWLAKGAGWVDELLPYLDFEAIREKAENRVTEQGSSVPDERLTADAGEMLGGFDAMSPAAHIWGPVMVLPYSGSDDCLVTLETIYEDVGHDQIRVVVIDATGAVIDAVEAVGLARVLDALDSLNLEAVLVGVGEHYVKQFRAHDEQLKLPVVATGLSEAITLGFQMSMGSR